MDQTFKQRVERILNWRNLQHLIPLYTNIYHIPERIFEYNPNLFVVFNRLSQKYEIHSVELGEETNSRQCELEHSELDVRALHYIWENDLRVHGWKIFERIEKSEDEAKKRKDKKYRDEVNALARDTQSLFARDSWGDGGQIQFQVKQPVSKEG